jgi:hypothetical protein
MVDIIVNTIPEMRSSRLRYQRSVVSEIDLKRSSKKYLPVQQPRPSISLENLCMPNDSSFSSIIELIHAGDLDHRCHHFPAVTLHM